MKGKVIAVANMKGGVGKTATVIGLAEALAAEGSEVLVIDLDPQANASICLAGSKMLKELIENGHTVDGYLTDRLFRKKDDIEFADCIRTHVSNVYHLNAQLPISLLASSSELRIVERDMLYRLSKSHTDIDWFVDRLHDLLRDQLKRTRKSYDYILFDCAPGISLLTEMSIRLANLVIVPTIPDFLSTYGLQTFCSNLRTGEMAKRTTLEKPKKPYVLVTRLRPINEHRHTVERLENEHLKDKPNFRLFETQIPERAAIAEALGKVDSWPSFSQKWKDTAGILESLSNETREALHGARS
ncbi:MAG: AAA family ATPase [Rhodopseudomonas sp.]|nr:AAA family ATPase [Rhodopseudomonas sp.]